MKNLCAWDSKQLSEWKEFLSCVGKLTSKKEPTWELNQILTLRSTLNFFWQTFKMRDSQIYRVLSIPQRQEYLLLGALAESSLHSNLSFFLKVLFSSYWTLQKTIYRGEIMRLSFLWKNIIIGSSRFGGISSVLKSHILLKAWATVKSAQLAQGFSVGLENLQGESLHRLSGQPLLDCLQRENFCYIRFELLKPCLSASGALLAHCWQLFVAHQNRMSLFHRAAY